MRYSLKMTFLLNEWRAVTRTRKATKKAEGDREKKVKDNAKGSGQTLNGIKTARAFRAGVFGLIVKIGPCRSAR